MDRIDARRMRDVEDAIGAQITLGRRCGADLVRLVRAADVQGVGVRLGVHCNGGGAKLFERAHHSQGDLPAVGDQDLVEHVLQTYRLFDKLASITKTRFGYEASAEQFGPRELLGYSLQAERLGFSTSRCPTTSSRGATPRDMRRTRYIEIKVSYDHDLEYARRACDWWAAPALSPEEKSGVEDPLEMERLADAALDRAHTRFIVSDHPEDCVERIRPYVELGFHPLVVPCARSRPGALPGAVHGRRAPTRTRALRSGCRLTTI